MGWLSKLGKIALVAAPYVAAPFTGGASLMATGATNAALQKWNQKDAQKRAAQGLAPSKFDRYLGYAGTGASLASGLGAFGALSGASSAANAASTAGKVATASKFANTLNNVNKGMAVAGTVGAIAGDIAANRGGGSAASDARSTGLGPTSSAMQRNGVMPRGGFRYSENPLNQVDQSNPNLALSIHQGRQEAIRNQPFRGGYTVNAINRDDVPYSYEQGAIYPNQRRRQQPVEATQ